MAEANDSLLLLLIWLYIWCILKLLSWQNAENKMTAIKEIFFFKNVTTQSRVPLIYLLTYSNQLKH